MSVHLANGRAAETQPTLTVVSHSAEETARWGAAVGERLAAGDVVVLRGQLGAGKTVFTQGIGRGLGVREHVISPTFTLLREHTSGRLPLYHVDAYRLAGAVEAYTFGLDEYLYGDGVTVIEWGERVETLLPEEYLAVDLVYGETGQRTITLSARGAHYADILRGLAETRDDGRAASD
ncbi:MAG: tRNA (adenosine(37)-N6)-threonylcarbamoyltransferase complex ATPase subunit type 1 TsaE [Anaerolineae bacterium]